jgi:hypothetical protein
MNANETLSQWLRLPSGARAELVNDRKILQVWLNSNDLKDELIRTLFAQADRLGVEFLQGFYLDDSSLVFQVNPAEVLQLIAHPPKTCQRCGDRGWINSGYLHPSEGWQGQTRPCPDCQQ